MNFFIRAAGTNYLSETIAFRAYVMDQGGVVPDPTYLNARIRHAKENGYYEDIVIWCGASFGFKATNGFVSDLYDVIDPENNSHHQATGSQRPELIERDSSLNNKPSLLGDGVDDILSTSHGNELLPTQSQYLSLLVFKPVTHSASSNKYLTGSKNNEIAPACSFREHTVSPIYRFPSLRSVNTSTDGIVLTMSSPGSPTGQWHILINSVNGHTFYKNNEVTSADLGNYVSDKPLLGSSLFGNQVTLNPTQSLTNYYLAERMIIKGEIDSTSANAIRDLINNYYNIF